MGKYGLALDNLQSVELVAADGRVLRASAEENPDLFWAVRGGGGNFGVVTSFEYRLFPVGPIVTGGLIAYSFDNTREMLRFYRDFTASVPDECSVAATLVHAPDGSGAKLAAMVGCHCGRRNGAGAAQAIRFAGYGSTRLDILLPAEQHA
jgi:FAD/FMN-containing dehydrogenase